MSIEDVARHESIILQIVSFNELKRGGLRFREPIDTSYLFESAVEPGKLVEARYPAVPAYFKAIAIAYDYFRGDEHISLEEIFWHEYFHMCWSPDLEPYDPTKHELSTHGMLDSKDEYQADLFAASVMIDHIRPSDTARSLCKRHGVSHKLAALALRIEWKKRLFSRDWKPEYELM
jgi:hypothetical protein